MDQDVCTQSLSLMLHLEEISLNECPYTDQNKHESKRFATEYPK